MAEKQDTTAAQAEKLKSLEAEQNEMRQLIQQGVTFPVILKYRKRKPGFWGYFRKREEVTEERVFTIAEPTLSTLDRLSAIWLELTIDETRLADSEYLAEAKQMAAKNAKLLARMVAIAVLGEDFYQVTEHAGTFQRKEDTKRVSDLADLFYHCVKPSDLFALAVAITNVSNLADFINSIRLMSATRTSDPTHLIEQQA